MRKNAKKTLIVSADRRMSSRDSKLPRAGRGPTLWHLPDEDPPRLSGAGDFRKESQHSPCRVRAEMSLRWMDGVAVPLGVSTIVYRAGEHPWVLMSNFGRIATPTVRTHAGGLKNSGLKWITVQFTSSSSGFTNS